MADHGHRHHACVHRVCAGKGEVPQARDPDGLGALGRAGIEVHGGVRGPGGMARRALLHEVRLRAHAHRLAYGRKHLQEGGEEAEGARSRFDGLVRIGIDETSYKKGHKYLTVVVDHDRGCVIWCGKGYGKKTLEEFLSLLTREQRESIRVVTADGARWIAEAIAERCPNAERAMDPFLLMFTGK